VVRNTRSPLRSRSFVWRRADLAKSAAPLADRGVEKLGQPPPYDPADLLKGLTLRIHQQIRSSRAAGAKNALPANLELDVCC